jgi:hypothetical protein
MKQTVHSTWRFTRGIVLALVIALGRDAADAAVTMLGAQYQPDQYFPEFNCYWNASAYPGSCRTPTRGATIHAYVKNTGTLPITITDASLGTYSLTTVIKKSGASWNPDEQNSIYFYWDDPPADIIAAGEPVWYRFDPPTIPAGGVAQVAVRLRSIPTVASVSLVVVTSDGIVSRSITVDPNAPQVASIGYSEDRKKVYLHWRRPGGTVPTSVWLDGTNVTASTVTVGDTNFNFGASVVSLSNALPHFSYHVFQGVYADGKTATASQRAWTNKFIYATYSTFATDSSYTTADWVAEAADHGFNNVQMNLGAMGGYLGTASGRADCQARGYGYTILDKTKLNPLDPDMFFLNDEPDAEENNQSNTHCGTGLRIPCDSGHWVGTLVIKTIAYGEGELRSLRPNVPFTVNLDGGLEPESFFTWGPAVDILQTDNYYEVRLKDSYISYPNRIPLFKNAKFSYAVARTCCAGAEPNPSNHLLYSNKDNDTGWPYPTPASKRFEAYYSLAGGSKGMGYWWLNPPEGLSRTGAAARALWREMGLVGNEIKTARPLIVRSTPVNLSVTPNSTNIWVRGVAAGTDSLILYVVNDNYFSDITGCHYTNVANAAVTVRLPSWMQASPTVFEITAAGLRDVETQLAGSQLQVNLGTLQLTRMIVVTTDPLMRPVIQQRYDQEVEAHVRNFAPDLFVNNPPTITQQPTSLSVAEGGTANFISFASGTSPLSYQWQKNQVGLSNGAHYSGCQTPMLTISGVDSADLASYRCVVTNAFGSATSRAVTLTLATNTFGTVTLTHIPPLPGDATNDARAVTPDGQWVVGLSGARGFLHAVNTTNVYSVATPDGAGSGVVSGVGYRTWGGQKQVVMAGLSSGWHCDFMTTDGTVFGNKRRDVNLGKAPAAVVANGLAGTASDVFYATWWDGKANNNQVYVGKMFGEWPMSPGAGTVLWDTNGVTAGPAASHGISGTGRAVGYTNSTKANYVLDWNGSGRATTWFFNGLNGTTAGEAWAVSADGSVIFGQSPVSGGRAGSWPYRAVVTTARPGVLQSIKELPSFGDTAGTSAGVPYGCTPDGKFAVGTSYRGLEKAVLWDVRDPNSTNWTVVDLTDLVLANGGPNIFSRLTRAYSVGTNATGDLVITGVGLDTNSPANPRAFVMAIALSAAPVISSPRLGLSGSHAAGLHFTFPTFADTNVMYYLEYTTNLTPPVAWTPIATAPGTGGLTSLADDDAPDPRRFYRLRVQVAPPPLRVTGANPAALTFTFPSVAAANVMYHLEYTTNLTPPINWKTTVSKPGYPNISGLSDPNPADGQRFYRVRVQ